MTATAVPSTTPDRVVGNVIRGCIGNLVEWYDWFAYAAFSVFFAKSFFPSEDPTAQLLSTAVVFAVGFLMRPLGGYLLGRFADRHGRKNALTLSVIMMASGSLLIACAPSYASIGIAAPLILVVARLIQGLSVGGEFGSSATYLSEIATPKHRGFFSSFQYVSIVLGQLIALAVQLVLLQVLTTEQMTAWGWRVPFFIGAAAAVTVMLFRRGMDESEQYLTEKAAAQRHAGEAKAEGSLRTLLRYPRQLAIVMGLAIGGTIGYYTYTTYMQKYMINTAGIDKETVAWINFAALFIFMCLQPLYGALSDRIGRRPMMIFFGVTATLAAVPLMTLLGRTTNPWAAFGLMTLGLVIITPYSALSAIVKAEMFPTKVRALGVGLVHAFAAAVFGGTAEPIALALKQSGHESVFFYYVAGTAALTLVASIAMKDTRAGSALDRAVPAEDPVAGAPELAASR